MIENRKARFAAGFSRFRGSRKNGAPERPVLDTSVACLQNSMLWLVAVAVVVRRCTAFLIASTIVVTGIIRCARTVAVVARIVGSIAWIVVAVARIVVAGVAVCIGAIGVARPVVVVPVIGIRV